MFHLFEKGRRNHRIRRIGISDAHDAFTVTDQFPNSPNIETGIVSGRLVDLDKVVAERVRTSALELSHHARIANAIEIM